MAAGVRRGEERAEHGGRVRKNASGVLPPAAIWAGRVLRREIHVTKEISRQRGLVGVGCGRSIVVKSEISG